ncbi:hypothetical protein HMPREF0262_02368 [Clostridium sp. ATCC 29733]|nr:hypothetical protein HMPREF0262_02368 [Clostridium sp. ATCC 29733]
MSSWQTSFTKGVDGRDTKKAGPPEGASSCSSISSILGKDGEIN